MNPLAEWFGFGDAPTTEELPDIYSMSITQADFVTVDIVSIYSKILTDVLERTHGLSDDQVALLWDNCLKSNAIDGVITLLAKAMADKADLFLVYEKGPGVIRVATNDERTKIEEDYKKQAKSSIGVFVTFKNFKRSDMIRFYIGLEYCTVAALNKSMNLSKAIQLKISELRSGVSLTDSAQTKAQGVLIANSLARGGDVMIDAKDSIETNVPDLTAVKAAIEFLINKLSFYLGMPDSYLIGEQTEGIGSSGENDMRAVERGLKAYYFSIMKPVLEAIFGATLSYKTQDVRQITSSLEALKTFDLISEEFVSKENKQKIINQLLNLPEDAEGDPVKATANPDPAVTPKPLPK